MLGLDLASLVKTSAGFAVTLCEFRLLKKVVAMELSDLCDLEQLLLSLNSL